MSSGHQLFLDMLTFEVKNFSEFFHLQSGLDSEFFRGGSGPTFFGHTKFDTKKIFWIFFVYRAFWTLKFLQGGVGSEHQLFLVMLNLRSKFILEFFHLQSALDSEFFRECLWAPTFFGHAKFEVKNFSEFFHLQSGLDSEFFRGGSGPTFFGHTKFDTKKFFGFFLFTEHSGL